jgi:hypothetical protein
MWGLCLVKYPFYIRMRCVQNRWGSGSCSNERIPTGSAVEKSLEAMMAERSKQDQKWSSSSSQPSKYTSSELKHQSQPPSSSERDQYAASSQ